MKHKYGDFSNSQIADTKRLIRKQIYFLLLIVDPKTRDEYENIDVNNAFIGLLNKLDGMNSVLFYPTEMVTVVSLLESALMEYNNPTFNYSKYRKLILDAGSEILKVKED